MVSQQGRSRDPHYWKFGNQVLFKTAQFEHFSSFLQEKHKIPVQRKGEESKRAEPYKCLQSVEGGVKIPDFPYE